jgi:hypothetical protein
MSERVQRSPAVKDDGEDKRPIGKQSCVPLSKKAKLGPSKTIPLPDVNDIKLIRKETLRMHPSDYIGGSTDKTLSWQTRIALRGVRERLLGIRDLRNLAMRSMTQGTSLWRSIYGKLDNFFDIVIENREDSSYNDQILARYVKFSLSVLKTANRRLRYYFRVTPKELRECPVDIVPNAFDFHWHSGKSNRVRPTVRFNKRFIEASTHL